MLSVLLTVLSASVLYGLATALYNVTLHPLSKVPGYRVAGMTRLYEMFWCHFNGRSHFYQKVYAMHQALGPVVRISPNELSLSDPQDFMAVYSIHSKYAKDPVFYRSFGVPHSMFEALQKDDHKRRRAPWASFFSSSSVSALSPVIEEKVTLLYQRALIELQDSQRIHMQHLLHTLMMDIVSEYTLPESLHATYRQLHTPDYITAALRRARWIWVQMSCTAASYAAKRLSLAVSKIASLRGLFDELFEILNTAVDTQTSSAKTTKSNSIFETMVSSLNYKNGVMSREVIIDELLSFNIAGTFNFGTTTSITLYHILSNSAVYEQLKTELQSTPITYAELKLLPYLTACLMEGLRLAYGPIGRLPRVVPEPGAIFQGHQVPPGVVVGVWSYVHHHNPDIWGNDHWEFNPGRWLGGSQSQKLKYLTTFGKDSRHCIGKELALATMYTCIATVVYKLPKLRVHGRFSVDDLDDHFAPVIPRSSQLVLSSED